MYSDIKYKIKNVFQIKEKRFLLTLLIVSSLRIITLFFIIIQKGAKHLQNELCINVNKSRENYQSFLFLYLILIH